jgi:mRNA-degrading endonuclease RelE of RelBE toxin-antitoxin system
MARHRIVYADLFLDDLRRIEAFERAKVRTALLILSDQAELAARNRRPLRGPVHWCPEATWQLRIEDYRVLYRVVSDEVQVLR